MFCLCGSNSKGPYSKHSPFDMLEVTVSKREGIYFIFFKFIQCFKSVTRLAAKAIL